MKSGQLGFWLWVIILIGCAVIVLLDNPEVIW